MDHASTPASERDAADSARAGAADEIRLPADALRRLSRLCDELGTGSIAVLREAGRAAGRTLVATLPASDGAPELGVDRFWAELGGAAEDAGYGRVGYRVLEADVGEVELRHSPEAGPDGSGGGLPPGGCHFAAGWIGGALSAAAGQPVAVMEVQCAAGDDATACRFLVGEESRLEEIRRTLRAGDRTVDEALEDR